MSRYCWESGTLTIPTKAWKTLRDGLVAAWNDRQEKALKLALRYHDKLLDIKKSSARGKFNAYAEFNKLFDYSHRPGPDELQVEELDVFEDIQRALFKREQPAGKPAVMKLQTPKKKDFSPMVASKATSFSAGYEGTISLNAAAHRLSWDVSENNHAVESARGSLMGRALFRLLGQVAWTRGSGGIFVGNDEYNRDAREAGGGGNYITATFGSENKKTAHGGYRRPVRRA